MFCFFNLLSAFRLFQPQIPDIKHVNVYVFNVENCILLLKCDGYIYFNYSSAHIGFGFGTELLGVFCLAVLGSSCLLLSFYYIFTLQPYK